MCCACVCRTAHASNFPCAHFVLVEIPSTCQRHHHDGGYFSCLQLENCRWLWTSLFTCDSLEKYILCSTKKSVKKRICFPFGEMRPKIRISLIRSQNIHWCHGNFGCCANEKRLKLFYSTCPIRSLVQLNLCIVKRRKKSRASADMNECWMCDAAVAVAACATLNMQTSSGWSLSAFMVLFHWEWDALIFVCCVIVVVWTLGFFLPCHSLRQFRSHTYTHIAQWIFFLLTN